MKTKIIFFKKKNYLLLSKISEAISSGKLKSNKKILDIKATGYLPKPDPKSYDIMLKTFGILSNQIESSIFIEDTAKNLKPAKLLGLKTVWMENERNLEDYKDNAEYIDYKYSDLKSFLNDISKNN